MKTTYVGAGAVLCLLLAGCATTPPSQPRAAPKEQVFIASVPPSQDTATVIFVRDSGILGSANYLHLYIDGQKAASLDPSEMIELTIASGEHVFGVKPTDPFGLSSMHSIDQDLKSGQVYRYRLTNTPNGSRVSREPEAGRSMAP